MQRLGCSKIPHIAVVGAGISGLRCTDVLTRAGARVTLLEARDRVGGRVHQANSGGHLVDMGPNWIHGTEGNPISRLAERTSTMTMEPEERQVIFDSDGNLIDEEKSGAMAAQIWGMIVRAFKHSDENSANIDKDVSLFDYFQQELKKETSLDEKQLRDMLNEAMMWGPFIGEMVQRQSLKFFFLEECLDGENVFVAGTYQKILTEIAKPALENAEVLFKEEVVRVEYRHSDDEIPVTLHTRAGKSHVFDEVVMTCPLGWLKQNKDSVFFPRLPDKLHQAIEKISYGRLEKLYITFPSAFWHDKTPASPTSQPDLDPQSSNTTEWPCFTHFHHPSYHPDPNSRALPCWNQSVVSLSHLPGPSSHPTLLFYLYGPCSSYLTTLLEPHPVHSQRYSELLTSFAAPFYSRLPHYSAECIPTSLLLTSWSTDALAGNGSYSNFQTGLESADDDIRIMRDAAGLGDGGAGLWLAGEHTAPFVALGTTTGAYWSGEGVARRIARRYGLDAGDEDGSVQKKAVEEKKPDAANLNGLAI